MSGTAPHNGTMTSILAARSVESSALAQEAAVFQYIRANGVNGRTREEIATDMHLDGNSVRPRVVELLDKGMIQESGEIRRGASGRAAKVLIASSLVRA